MRLVRVAAEMRRNQRRAGNENEAKISSINARNQ